MEGPNGSARSAGGPIRPEKFGRARRPAPTVEGGASLKAAQRILNIPPYPFTEIARIKARVLGEGADLIDLGIGDPDQPTPAHIVEALCEAARDPSTHRYDESDYGPPEFISAAVEWFAHRFGVELDPRGEIKITIGAKEALAHILWACLDPGDVAIVPDPRYAVYEVNTRMAGATPHRVPLWQENDYLPDLEAIPQDVLDRAQVLCLNYPNNPTGATADPGFFQRAVDFALHHDLIICHDAAYSEVYYDGRPTRSILQAEGAKQVAIEFHSLSKTFNMTGWRIGFAVGARELIEALAKIKQNVDSNLFPALARAGAAALAGPQDCLEDMRRTYQTRRDLLVEELNGIGWPVPPPRAAFYLWGPVPAGYDSNGFAEVLLRDAHILVTPGTAYGRYGEGFVRMSLTLKHPDVAGRLREAARRIACLGLQWH